LIAGNAHLIVQSSTPINPLLTRFRGRLECLVGWLQRPHLVASGLELDADANQNNVPCVGGLYFVLNARANRRVIKMKKIIINDIIQHAV
jgi:hypothetical protein